MMRNSKIWLKGLVFLCAGFFLMSCHRGNHITPPPTPDGDCYVVLFDGDNFTDDYILIKGPGEFASLKSLPGSHKNWNDEADSFVSGDSATVILWSKTNFRGDSVVFQPGAKESSIDEPSSMKIICGKMDNGDNGNGGEGDNGNGDNQSGDCHMTLFDGDNFKDDSIVVKSGEYKNLDNLPGSEGDSWTDEADSFKVGPHTTVTVWTQTDFKGDSTVYETGDYASVDEPYSMKVVCNND